MLGWVDLDSPKLTQLFKDQGDVASQMVWVSWVVVSDSMFNLSWDLGMIELTLSIKDSKTLSR